jgi:MFS transporter, DHA2 family, multidrug resistance protein
VLLSLATILPVVYGLKELAHTGWSSVPVAAVVLGTGCGWVFVRRQQGLAEPLVDIALFRNRQFSSGLGVNLGGGVVMAGTFLAPQLARRYRPAYAMAAGLAVAAAGLLLVSRVDDGGGLGPLLTGFALACVGIAVPSALIVNLIVGSAPPEKAGTASGLSETSGELGIALGVAVIGSVAATFYRGQVSVPDGVTAEAGRVIRESLAGAVTGAGQLSGGLGNEVLVSARDSFTSGLQVAALLGATLFTVMAVVVLVAFRHLRPYGGRAVPDI